MRDLLLTLEAIQAQPDPAETYVAAAEPMCAAIPGGSIILFAKSQNTVEIHTIDADVPRQGYGKKTMAALCTLADQKGVNLTLEVECEDGDDDDWSVAGDHEDDDGDDDHEDAATEPSTHMNSDQLIGWYSGYGFETSSAHWSRIRMVRKPNVK